MKDKNHKFEEEDAERSFKVVRISMFITSLIVCILIFLLVLNSLTSRLAEPIQIHYKCIDKRGGVFEDEMCSKEIKCGWIPFLNPSECEG